MKLLAFSLVGVAMLTRAAFADGPTAGNPAPATPAERTPHAASHGEHAAQAGHHPAASLAGGAADRSRGGASNRNGRGPARPSGGRPNFTVDRDSHRGWDRRRDHVHDHHRYHWSGRDWLVFDLGAGGYPYSYGYPYEYRYSYGYATARQDEDRTPFVPIEARVQDRLKQKGYYRGRVDGLIGPGTRSAITHYQRDHGLQANGHINGPLLDALELS